MRGDEGASGKKGRSWSTALYCFAEGIRELTGGGVNYKVLYSLIGTRGDYINHASPTMRVSSAPALSRLIHSGKYVDDLLERFETDPQVFSRAGEMLCGMLDERPEKLLGLLCGELWESVEEGFDNERHTWRPELNLNRLRLEMESLFAHCAASLPDDPVRSLRLVLECYFQALAFGCLDEGTARLFIEDTPLFFIDSRQGDELATIPDSACLIKVFDNDAIGGVWYVGAGRTVVGRYTDCDIIETEKCVSRRHCEIVQGEDGFTFRDLASSHGSTVERGGETVYDSACADAEPLLLEHGDVIVLSGLVKYRMMVLSESTAVGSGSLLYI